MNSAVRRTGMYLYSSAAASAPRSVRAPHTTRAEDREGAQAVDPERIEQAVLGIGHAELQARDAVERRVECRRAPSTRRAGRRCAPSRRRSCRSRANVSIWPSSMASACLMRGKKSAALRAASPVRFMPATPVCALLIEFQPALESTRRNARRLAQ